MNKIKTILVVIVSIIIVSSMFVIYKAHQNSKIPFIDTLGFYFDGIDADDPDLITCYGKYKENVVKTQIYCFQQYRSSEKYIYEPWRNDFKFSCKVENIVLELPDSIWNKINTIWFKNGDFVIKYTKEQMMQDWSIQEKNSTIRFCSNEKQIKKNSFKSGLDLFLSSSHILGIKNKYLLYAQMLILSLILVFIFKNIFYTLFLKFTFFLKTKISRHKSFWTNLFASFTGIVTIFLILELSLRIVGYIHEKNNIIQNYKLAENADKVVICLGDSFTEGFGSSKGNDYPSVLNNLIQGEFGEEYQTINLGQSGKNTTQIREEFNLYLENHTPELVILMAGSANYWNYYGFEDNGKFLYNIRTFKLIKLLYNNIFNNSKNINELSANKNLFNKDFYHERRENFAYKCDTSFNLKTISKFQRYINNQIPICDYADSLFRSNNIDETEIRELIYYSWITKTNIVFPNSIDSRISKDLLQLLTLYRLNDLNPTSVNQFENAYYRAMYFYVLSLRSSKKAKANYLYLAIAQCPYLEDAYFDLYSSGHFTPYLPIDFKQKAICIKDTLSLYNRKFRLPNYNTTANKVHIKENLNLDINTNKINQWAEVDLEDIINQCRKKGVKLILMTYPYKYKNPLYEPINGVIEQLSVRYSIQLIDNYTVFKNLDNQKEYYVSDGHCSDKGYVFIANQVFNLIIDKKILDKTE